MKIHIRVLYEQKLVSFIKHQMPLISYQILNMSLRKKDIIVNSHKMKMQTLLKKDDIVSVWSYLLEKYRMPKIVNNWKSPIAIKILFQNDDFIIIDKPAGIPSQGGTKVNFSIIDILKYQLHTKPYIVHRLDKDVSGMMIVALNAVSASKLSGSLRNREWKKIYHAQCMYHDNLSRQGIINDDIDNKNAITKYKMLYQNKNIVTYELEAVTGRKHQLRIHCSKYLSPIIGDKKYNINHYDGYIKLRCIQIQPFSQRYQIKL